MKQSDLKILAELRKNSRQTLTNISKNTKIPVSTVYDRIRACEEKIIKKHTSILDFPKMGFNIRANILVEASETQTFEEFVLEHKNINSVFRINSDFNFIIDCIFREMSEFQNFIESLTKITIKKQVHFVVDELKRENFFAEQAI